MNSWFRFYHEALDDPKVQKLTPELFRDWVNILCLTCRTGGFLPDLTAVSFALRKSEIDTTKTIDALCITGLLDRFKSGKLRPHNWDSRQFKSDNSYERVKRFRNASRNGVKRSNETPPDTEQIQTPIVPHSHSQLNADGYTDDFQRFWSAYPKKTGKGKAFELWMKNGHPGIERIVEVLELAKRSPKWLEKNGQFIPNPATWLNQKRWDDDYSAKPQTREAVY